MEDRLPSTLFAKNRARFFKLFHESVQTKEGDFALFRGASEVPIYSSDICYPEYQEAYFYYLTGVEEMDCHLIVDLHKDHVILFVPQLDNMYKIWMNIMTKEQMADKYSLEVRYMSELEDTMKSFEGRLFINNGVNSDSNLKTDLPDEKYLKAHQVDRETMHDIIAEARVVKNDEEILAMRWASQITAEAHCNVMKNVKPEMRECQLESFFNFYGQQHYFTGRVAPYMSICGCGPSAATLHY